MLSFIPGLLELIIDLLPSLKTMDLDKIFKIVLRPQVLVVMVHHAAAEIRITILRVIIPAIFTFISLILLDKNLF